MNEDSGVAKCPIHGLVEVVAAIDAHGVEHLYCLKCFCDLTYDGVGKVEEIKND